MVFFFLEIHFLRKQNLHNIRSDRVVPQPHLPIYFSFKKPQQILPAYQFHIQQEVKVIHHLALHHSFQVFPVTLLITRSLKWSPRDMDPGQVKGKALMLAGQLQARLPRAIQKRAEARRCSACPWASPASSSGLGSTLCTGSHLGSTQKSRSHNSPKSAFHYLPKVLTRDFFHFTLQNTHLRLCGVAPHFLVVLAWNLTAKESSLNVKTTLVFGFYEGAPRSRRQPQSMRAPPVLSTRGSAPVEQRARDVPATAEDLGVSVSLFSRIDFFFFFVRTYKTSNLEISVPFYNYLSLFNKIRRLPILQWFFKAAP